MLNEAEKQKRELEEGWDEEAALAEFEDVEIPGAEEEEFVDLYDRLDAEWLAMELETDPNELIHDRYSLGGDRCL